MIGTPVGVTGSSSATTKYSVDVALAWQDWVNNDLGGLNGHPVRVVVKDTKGDAATASAIAHDMIDVDKAIAIIGANDSGTESVWAKIASDAGVPVVAVNYTGTLFTAAQGGLKNVFGTQTTQPNSTAAVVVSAKALGAGKFGALVCAEVPACGAAAVVLPGIAATLGVDYAGIVKAAAADANYLAQCTSMQSAGVDYFQMSTTAATYSRVIDDCGKQGYRPVFGVSGGSVTGPDLVTLSKSGVRFGGSVFAFPWWVSTAPVKQYRDVMTKYAPGKSFESNSSTATWTAFEWFRKAMANASDSPTAPEALTAITSLKNETLGGLLPQPLTYTKDQGGPVINCFWPYKLQDGVFSGGTTTSCWNP